MISNRTALPFFILTIILFLENDIFLGRINSLNVTYAYEITIIINEIGIQNILSNIYSSPLPSSLQVNGIVEEVERAVDLLNQTNEIKMTWNSSQTDLSYMFYNLSNISEIDLSNYDSSNVNNLNYMFYNCTNLIKINLTNFQTKSVNSMSYMFSDCSNLTSINLSNFNTSLVINMDHMFSGCSKLTSIDLSSFDTSNLNVSSYMFDGCSSIKSLDLSNFNTSSITQMDKMFQGCNDLEYINLTNWITSSVLNMGYMFHSCYSLVSLDLGYFDTSNVESMEYMFYSCNKLESLNLSSFDTSSVTNMDYMFHNCSSLLFLDICGFNSSNLGSNNLMFNTENLLYCYNPLFDNSFISQYNESWSPNCSEIYFANPYHKIVPDLSICINNCNYTEQYKYEYNNVCYSSCPNTSYLNSTLGICLSLPCPDGYYVNDTLLRTIDKCHPNCSTCEQGPTENSTNCLSCIEGLVLFEPFSDNNCYSKDLHFPGYFFNDETNRFEHCYFSCEYCNANESLSSGGNHNCIACKEGFYKSYEYLGNCYQSTSSNSDKIIIDSSDSNFTSIDSCLDTNRTYKIASTGECVSQCPTQTYYIDENYNLEQPPNLILGHICYLECPSSSLKDSESNICICDEKYFNDECVIECPGNTKLDNDNYRCICEFNFYNKSNYLICLDSASTCESENYLYMNQNSGECFKTVEECLKSGLKVFNNICQEECPENSQLL